ncbi:MAG: riboflavin synthase [Chloroflexi bacterium]|nr:riboflavin synthase [Chloroflexota bacterium]
MFTGIVQETGIILAARSDRLVIGAREVVRGLIPGGSVAVNGACLTATEITPAGFTVDVMPETLEKTNLGGLRPRGRVNLERPLGLGGELGGHLVQGHVDGAGRVAAVAPEGDALIIRFEAPPEIMRYIVYKGFIAIDGVSLTVTGLDARSFAVSVVGFTRRHTTLGERRAGDTVNLEADIIAKYVERFTRGGAGITEQLLTDSGFLVH